MEKIQLLNNADKDFQYEDAYAKEDAEIAEIQAVC
jgi:hypothetical protein